MDALLRALDARGLAVDVIGPKEIGVWLPSVTLTRTTMPVTLAHVDGEAIPFAIDELTENVQVNPGDPARYRPPTFAPAHGQASPPGPRRP